MEKRKLTPEHKKAMLGDLMQRYPRGNNGKLRHYHYRTTMEGFDDWGESRRLDDPVLDPDHPKLPQQEEDTFLGWKLSDIWLIDPSEWALRPVLRVVVVWLRDLVCRSQPHDACVCRVVQHAV